MAYCITVPLSLCKWRKYAGFLCSCLDPHLQKKNAIDIRILDIFEELQMQTSLLYGLCIEASDKTFLTVLEQQSTSKKATILSLKKGFSFFHVIIIV